VVTIFMNFFAEKLAKTVIFRKILLNVLQLSIQHTHKIPTTKKIQPQTVKMVRKFYRTSGEYDKKSGDYFFEFFCGKVSQDGDPPENIAQCVISNYYRLLPAFSQHCRIVGQNSKTVFNWTLFLV
jgi:hypothetical protein